MTDTLAFLKDILARLEGVKDINLHVLKSDLFSIDTADVTVYSEAVCEDCCLTVEVEINDIDTSDIDSGIKDALFGVEVTEKELADVIEMLRARILRMETPTQAETLFDVTQIVTGTAGDMEKTNDFLDFPL